MRTLLKEEIPIPKLDVQHSICEIVDQENKIREFIDLPIGVLQERRTALISAAVTGKIDVRGWKRPSSDARLETEMEVV
tara:strand:- start:443 stop:679 length:237 start_codon:yes stop_codon:yes gene_type:complete